MDLHGFWIWLVTDERAPAWIQALGSIAAIIASVVIAIWIDRVAVRRRVDEALRQSIAANGAGRRAVVTARAMLRSVADGAKNYDQAKDPGLLESRRWRRRLYVAIEQLEFHVNRGRTAADVAFAALFTKRELIEVVHALTRFDEGGILLDRFAELAAESVTSIGDVLDELDSGVLSM